MSLTQEQMDWIDKALYVSDTIALYRDNIIFTKNEKTGLVDISFKGGYEFVHFIDDDIEMLPIAFGRVDGGFSVEGGKINTFTHFPTYIKGDFKIKGLNIQKLVNLPNYIGGGIEIMDVPLLDLSGLPDTIFGSLKLTRIPITTLKPFFPKRVFGSIFINLPITTLEGLPPLIYDGLQVKNSKLENLKTSYPIKFLGYPHFDRVKDLRLEDSNLIPLTHNIYLEGEDNKGQTRSIKFLMDYKGRLSKTIEDYPHFFGQLQHHQRFEGNRPNLTITREVKVKPIKELKRYFVGSLLSINPSFWEIIKDEKLVDHDDLKGLIEEFPDMKLYL
jgi:hypothetical protein